jgi:ABC-type multidrug transport system ATPase subunit
MTKESSFAHDQKQGAEETTVSTSVRAPLAVRVRGLVKRYKDGTEATRGIDLDVRRGELISILGPNGAGKTTFLRQVTTELRPTTGSVEIFGIDAVSSPERAKRMMGITPQEAGVFESLTVREHFELFARLKGLANAEAGVATHKVIESLGLVTETGKRVGLLSGGQRRRILIGLALLGLPPLLVLDEPTTGLDPSSRQAVWGVIRRAVTDGATVILSTHYMEEAERLSDRIGIITEGRLIAFGTLDELLAQLERSYRLSYRDPLDPFGKMCVRYFASFAETRAHIATAKLSEYSIARASLEDVYFALTGERFAEGETEGSA